MRPAKYAFAFSIFLLCVVGLVSCVYKSDRTDIVRWVQERKEYPIDIQYRWHPFSGPYHFNHKGHRIYRVQTESDRVFWFRMGNLFAADVHEEKAGKYILLQ